jgi:hypothetical protein
MTERDSISETSCLLVLVYRAMEEEEEEEEESLV